MAIAEIIFSGFVSKTINDAVDISKDKIKKAVKDKNNKHQSLESQIYNVTVDVFNQITNNQYENNQDKIYEAAENLLTGYISNKEDDIEVIRSSLKLFYPNVDNDKCMEFMRLLYQELSRDVYGALYREIRLLQEEQESRKATRIEQKVDEIKCGIDALKSNSQMQSIPQNNAPKQKVKSRTQEYADKWNANMFLNDFDKRDENTGVNIKLSEVYLEEHLPHYFWGKNENPSCELKTLLSEYIDKKIDNNMLLILGQQGIGKSTLITWITANFISRVDDIMIYQFATDLKDIDWQSYNISNRILDALNLSYNDLNGKTLILDGFDEVSVGDRKEILDKIYWEFIKGRNVERFSLIITCRENYINNFERIQCKYITLLPWDEMQIKSFCTTFQDKTKCDISEHTLTKVINNKQILGIPLILYMVLALNIAIEKEGSIVDIYDKIFSLEGGIYDRCLYEQPHRIGGLKKQIHQISREIAIWMFENNPVGVYISQIEYEKICDSVMKEQERNNQEIKRDILISNYFKLVRHSEGGAEGLFFVHRSIYEYFVAETIYSSIKDTMLELSEESKKELAGKIAVYLKKGRITTTIGEYLQYMILQLYQSLNGKKQERFYTWWESTVDMMMSHGMFYFTGKNIQVYEAIIEKETNCFVNLLKILRRLFVVSNQSYIFENIQSDHFEKYIILRLIDCKWELFYGTERFNLSKVFLSEIDFERVNLTFAYLEHACLTNSNLSNANLRRVVLTGADLQGANLSEANLRKSSLVGADLRKTNLRKADLRKADLRGANLSGAYLQGANLCNAFLEVSIWFESDIWKALSQLKGSKFGTLQIIDGDEVKQVSRRELFPDEKSSPWA